MNVWILYCTENKRAVLYDSVSETAFGHGFNEGEQSRAAAETFLRWFKSDPRPYSMSYMAYMEWFCLTHCDECGEAAFDFDHLKNLDDESFDEVLASGGHVRCEACACKQIVR
jgi:hypothetical protein